LDAFERTFIFCKGWVTLKGPTKSMQPIFIYLGIWVSLKNLQKKKGKWFLYFAKLSFFERTLEKLKGIFKLLAHQGFYK
jgi:hypothetical protein